MHWRCW